jgi:aspartyl-tRNA(Asn)/glutamyl-tRNA(Gln) amidotransferase subunit C
MKLSPQEAATVARLARLRLPEETLGRFAAQMGDILSYMETLNALDTRDVEPLYGPVEHEAPLRPDVAVKTCTRDEVLQNAPETDGRFFIVPKIVTG